MNIEKLIDKGRKSLILCLTGWSTAPNLFKHLEEPKESDLWIAYDYRNLSFNEDLSKYSEIHLIAWSLGVWVADHLWSGKRVFTTATAINGTPCPIDDMYGIPPIIFKGTLDNITEEGMRRFNRRMCGDRECLNRYENLGSRSIDEKRDELESLYMLIRESGVSDFMKKSSSLWKMAIISTNDRIFPTENLHNYWQDTCTIKEIEAAHLPFFKFEKWEELWSL